MTKQKSLLSILLSHTVDDKEERATLSSALKYSTRFGLLIVLIVVLFFGVWGSLAPIDSAAIAPGSVVLDQNRKTVQHLEGGIIERILVKEGDLVEQGDPLIRLNETAAKAKLQLLLVQYWAAKGNESRLIAERDGLEEIIFDSILTQVKDHQEVQKIFKNQESLFATRKKAIRGKVEVLENQMTQYEDQIDGLKAQSKATKNQIKLVQEEIVSVEKLFRKGLYEKPRLLALKRNAEELAGKEGEYKSEIAKAHESITETKIQILNHKNEYLNETLAEMKEVQQRISDLTEELRAAKDVSERIVIAAPQSGKITGLKFHTVGGVISPGEAVLDIVPQNDMLVVEAMVSPQDIDIVHEGLQAKVMLSAYRNRFVPRLDGNVTYVSADKFTEETTGQPFYKARISIEPSALEGLAEDVKLYPGMPADVFIVTGSRTFLRYIISPIIDSFHKAFKEG